MPGTLHRLFHLILIATQQGKFYSLLNVRKMKRRSRKGLPKLSLPVSKEAGIDSQALLTLKVELLLNLSANKPKSQTVPPVMHMITGI